MRKWQKLLMYVLAVTFLFGISAVRAEAADNKAYTYRITFYSGNIGEFKDAEGLTISNEAAVVTQDADKIVVSGLNLGDTVGFNAPANVELDASDKHYVQGVRLGGYDNDTVAASVFTVERDRDYVVAYGIKGNMATYTIKYQDNYGNTLAPDEVYYGNVGDKPVVPYLYVDGYVPRYIGLTKTLSANNAENIFVFIYDKIPEPTVPTVPEGGGDTVIEEVIVVVRPSGGGTGTGGSGAAGGNTGTETDSEGTGDDEGGDTEGTGNAEGTEETDDGTENEEGEDDQKGQGDILDLDDEEVPLANPEQEADADYVLKLAGCIALGVAAIVLVVYILVLLTKKDTKKEAKEDSEEA